MFERFSVSARGRGGRHRGFVGGPSSLDRRALATIGIDVDLVRDKIEASFGPDAFAAGGLPRRRRRRRTSGSPSGHIPLTERAKECLQRSVRETEAGPASTIGVEHLALALTAMTGGPVGHIFAAAGASASGVHAEIERRDRQAG